ncbi:glycosyltransferase [Rothia sp. ZJ932]|uniref:glycosyltransferase n=1 Tax=Rothia sp. ZJ932 TaxID=2810516 RepID=UPI00196763A1|nr:glycosyltransferase [Rothia sp. ZJ932]QRZ61201.1 glycosyltransferase [Rothia sp. ZJ932]
MALNSSTPVALWVVPVPEFGGVARHVVDVAAAGLPGYELVVLAPSGHLTDELKKMGVRILTEVPFGVDAGFKKSFDALNIAIESEKPAVVHAHLAYADIVAAAVITSRKIKRVKNKALCVPALASTEHGIADSGAVYNTNKLRALAMKTLHNLRLRVTDHKISVSASTSEQMAKQWGAREVEVVRNGIDVQGIQTAVAKMRTASDTNAPRLLSLSRLAPEKGLDYLIDAFALLAQKYPQAHLEVAGAGELEAELKMQVNNLSIAEAVSFPGFVNPLEAMGRADIIVQLSMWENLSYTLLDAKAAGLKVLATDVGGNREIVGEEELAAPLESHKDRQEQIRTLARALEKLWSSPQILDGAPTYSREQMNQAIVQVYGKREKI